MNTNENQNENKTTPAENIPEISSQTEKIIAELLASHPQKKGSFFVIGCSTSEVAGGSIGKDSSAEIGKAIFTAAERILTEKGIFLACQCCEHLNRALVVERECAEKYGLDEVSVVPWIHGGGSFATAAYYAFKEPVVVEHIKAAAGLDIGSTLIGMHLKEVAVPVHPKQKFVGKAYVTAAYSRPKLIGGERARYTAER
ncbi:TIGR01440 family protein [uncultured Treponema sp.]|uniref:TIGR01440 family protein n=1 Tax=uncultured Treponema sp. TaxID=162155 RepID=UPI0025FEA85F|nr:TIGR01440 family protein [uncultured Treponema sp.]MEE0353790.1 TIGR01440 family protein [Treponema sp.]